MLHLYIYTHLQYTYGLLSVCMSMHTYELYKLSQGIIFGDDAKH